MRAPRRPARSPSRGLLAAVVCVGVAAALWLPGQVPRSVAGVQAAAPTVSQLHSPFAGAGQLQVWGNTDAPDGSTIELSIAAHRGGAIRRAAPAVAGRFVTQVPIPKALRGRSLHVSAALAP